MKFRTEIDIAPLGVKIGYGNRILALGSCFAEHIAGRLAEARFRIVTNPTGILFNPLSIAAALRSYADEAPVQHTELDFDGELWFHYGFHGSLSAASPDEALSAMNAARKAGAEALRRADRVLLTLGTAWVYEHNGQVVANCHRQPATEFVRRRLGVAEITGAFSALLAGPLAGKEVILTVSPVRHLGDGLEGNAVSKATLRLAAEELAAAHAAVHYFPAYEVLNDDLRDYRFYADDLVHPSAQAIQYVWEKFIPAVLSDEARRLLPDVRHIVVAAAHRPRNPRSEAYEVLNDDLRDYRFYADDLVHPSAQAIQYVWEKFIPAVLSDEARRLLPDVRHIVVAAAHRPRNPRSEAYREFCRRRIGEIAALPQVDFQAEEEYFRRCIEINS